MLYSSPLSLLPKFPIRLLHLFPILSLLRRLLLQITFPFFFLSLQLCSLFPLPLLSIFFLPHFSLLFPLLLILFLHPILIQFNVHFIQQIHLPLPNVFITVIKNLLKLLKFFSSQLQPDHLNFQIPLLLI